MSSEEISLNGYYGSQQHVHGLVWFCVTLDTMLLKAFFAPLLCRQDIQILWSDNFTRSDLGALVARCNW